MSRSILLVIVVLAAITGAVAYPSDGPALKVTTAGLVLLGIGAVWATKFLVRAGLFTSVEVSEREFPGFRLAYKTHTSQYKECGQHFHAACELAKGKDCDNYSTVGVYFDNPEAVEVGKTRYAVGISIPKDSSSLEEAFKAKGYQFVDLPRTPAIYTTFPFTSMLSIFIAIMRVYPKMGEYEKKTGKCAYPYMEVCKMGVPKTEYYGMLDNHKTYMMGLTPVGEYAKANPPASKKTA